MVSCFDFNLPTILAIPDLKIYAWCRCKVVASDKSEDHLHWHGLVHFRQINLESWRRQVTRKGVKLPSRKNTFKKIHGLDHIVGVLKCLACDQGQVKLEVIKMDLSVYFIPIMPDNLFSDYHRHCRGKAREDVRTGISKLLANHIDFLKKENWNWLNLHNAKTCKCVNGDLGRKKIREANEKRRAFYKTSKGLAVKKAYKQKAAKKRQIINQLAELRLSKKASLHLATI